MKTKITETETEYIVNGDLILTEDFKISKHLIVHGDVEGKDGERFNINARNIDAGNINAWNIDARNIDARNINAWNIDARNINALDINAWNIDAWNIDARNIICETRVKKDKKCKTIARIYIKNRSKIKRKEHDD
ncbi:MAG: hypothetical protein ABSG05_03580 [Candidatus Pacearchaeota archaeon]|jgi:hypothetical protein